MLESGAEVGLSIGLIAGRTRAEALASAETLVRSAGEQARAVHQGHRGDLDSVGFRSTYAMADRSDWVTDHLWIGAVPQLRLFGEEILPRLRDRGTPGGLSTFHSRGDVTTL